MILTMKNIILNDVILNKETNLNMRGLLYFASKNINNIYNINAKYWWLKNGRPVLFGLVFYFKLISSRI